MSAERSPLPGEVPVPRPELPRTGEVVLGGYRLVRRLGEGGMGAVFLAKHEETGQESAIKVFRPEIASPELEARFLSEARALARLEHPNVVRLLHFASERDTRYLVMGFVDGEPLSDLVARGPLDLAECRRVTRSLLKALAHAHERGVLHRDVKPANLVVREDGRVVLVDFGIASGQALPGVTRDDVIVGTPEYLSPERIRRELVDERTDLYAAGVVLFEMLTGARPFARETPIATVCAQLDDPVPDPAEMRGEDLPSDLRELVTALLAKLPADRPASAREALAMLSDARQPRVLELLADVTGSVPTRAADVAAGDDTESAAPSPRPSSVDRASVEETEIVRVRTRPLHELADGARPPGARRANPTEDDDETRRLLRHVQRTRRRAVIGLSFGALFLASVLVGLSFPEADGYTPPGAMVAPAGPAMPPAPPPPPAARAAEATDPGLSEATAGAEPSPTPTTAAAAPDRPPTDDVVERASAEGPSAADAPRAARRAARRAPRSPARSATPSPREGAPSKVPPLERLDDATLRAVTDGPSSRRQVRGCYESLVDDKRAGTITVEARVEPTGVVTWARVREQDVGGGRFARCIEKVARRWRFPAFTASQPLGVRQRFSLSPSG